MFPRFRLPDALHAGVVETQGRGAHASYDLTIVSENQRGKPLPSTRWTATVPTLVVAGGKSPAWMRNAMQALARVLPNAKHHTLEGQTHMVSPKALAPVLAEFFGR